MLAQHPLRRFNFKSAAELGLRVQRSGRTEKSGRESPDQGFLAAERGADKQVPQAFVPADPPLASTDNAPPRRLQRDPASPCRSQPLRRCGQAGNIERTQSHQRIAPDDVLSGEIGLRSWPIMRKPRQQLAPSAGAHRIMACSQSCELCGCVAAPSLAARRGLAITVDTRWRVSKDGISRITHSAASRLLNGSNCGSTGSRICSSCAGDSSRATTKPSSAKHVGKGDFNDTATSFSRQMPTSTRLSRQMSTGSLSHSRQISTDVSTCADSASPWPPHDWSMDSQSLRCTLNEQRKSKIQQCAQLAFS
jgi:hypothetical protein